MLFHSLTSRPSRKALGEGEYSLLGVEKHTHNITDMLLSVQFLCLRGSHKEFGIIPASGNMVTHTRQGLYVDRW